MTASSTTSARASSPTDAMSHLPAISVVRAGGGVTLAATGRWNVHTLSQGMSREEIGALRATLAGHARTPGLIWDLEQVEAMDHVGAMMFRRAAGGARPVRLQLRPEHDAFFVNLDKSEVQRLLFPIVPKTP